MARFLPLDRSYHANDLSLLAMSASDQIAFDLGILSIRLCQFLPETTNIEVSRGDAMRVGNVRTERIPSLSNTASNSDN